MPVSFVALGLEVEPGAEFEVSDEDTPRLLARPDVEEAAAPVRRKAEKKPAEPADAPAGAAAPAPVTEEVDRGVSDDH
jgi:hypothetical protein